MLSHQLRAAAGQRQTLYQIISNLGLTTNLKLCLDAGDAASYDPNVQTNKWLDVSGNGYDFYRGGSGSGDAAEPTFNGTAGQLSKNEYWSFDGGDYFLYDTTNEAWMQTLHKDGAVYSIFAVIYISALDVSDRIFATRPTGATGFVCAKGSTNVFQSQAYNGSSLIGAVTSTATATVGWNIVGWSLNENGGSSNGRVKVNNNSVETSTVSYSSPSTSNTTGTAAIGSLANGSSPNQNGNRFACLAVWSGTALNSQNLTDIYNAIKGRFQL